MNSKMKLENIWREKKTIIVLVIILLLLAGIGTYIYYVAKSNYSSSDFKAVGNVNMKVEEATKLGRNLTDEAKSLNAKYGDVKAWLRIPGTSIDTAVFQSTDNDRYYRNNRDNESTKWGEVYLDYRCNVANLEKQNIIIYGHNTEADNNFSPLLNYKSKDFYKNHKIIELSNLNGNYRFEIFSVYTTDTSFFYIDTNFKDATEFKSFIKSINAKSSYSTGVAVKEDDTILTLSTCDYTIDNGRYVVQARLIKQ